MRGFRQSPQLRGPLRRAELGSGVMSTFADSQRRGRGDDLKVWPLISARQVGQASNPASCLFIYLFFRFFCFFFSEVQLIVLVLLC